MIQAYLLRIWIGVVQKFRSKNQFNPFQHYHIEDAQQEGGFDAWYRFGKEIVILFRYVMIQQQDYSAHSQSRE